ncbi:MAG: CoA ester lyase [Acholeplasmatales bacterium]|jgi:citrate lyase subunit beta/citryl-CoA lyase|nr:CoA ester lyase [Acholeplasmataceae bacterium]MDY0114971.1 CoA ester lyase [Acholeplasmatales bacterium]MCK9234242.1 CoA ester lyase [Acholeplasmataceae bacterium]MCK9289796.1 CoA ester lyase [Acholeplasmataceae bacterium]MCK9427891.1 CoA ester lyase [Acholeplasmataceae bacterium]
MKRSILFIPGNNPSMIQDSYIFEADGIIYDLEDAVAYSEKDSARIIVKSFIESGLIEDKEVIVRINDIDSEFYLDDINVIVSNYVDTIMLPMATEWSVRKLATKLDEIEEKKKIAKRIKIIPIIESGKSVLEVEKIVRHQRVSGVLLGAEDLSFDLGIIRTKEGAEIEYVRSKIVIAAKAYKKDAIDTPFTDVTDDEGLIKDTKRAKLLGMNAKACIHPRQARTINKVFSPSSFDIDFAKKVLKGYEEAQKVGLGVFSLEGKMIDKPIVERAQSVIMRAKYFKLENE